MVLVDYYTCLYNDEEPNNNKGENKVEVGDTHSLGIQCAVELVVQTLQSQISTSQDQPMTP